MKKIKYLIFGVLALIVMPKLTYATSMRVSISCGDMFVGRSQTCTIKGTSSGGSISSISTNVKVSGSASSLGFTPASGWSGNGDGGQVMLYTDSNKSGTFTIGQIKIKGKSNGTATISVTSGTISDSDFNESTFSGISKTINIKEKTTKSTTKKSTTTTSRRTTTTTSSTTTTMYIPTTSMTTSQVVYNPGALELTSVSVGNFEVTKENGIYYSTVSADTAEVEVMATADAGIKIYGTGLRGLAEGKNLVELVIRNSQNETKKIQVIIIRPNANGEYDTTLARLNVTGYNLSFNPTTLEYNVTVPSELKEVYVLAEGTDDVIITGDGVQPLGKGNKDIYVKVAYGNLATTTYTLHIKRSYKTTFMWIAIGILSLSLIISIYVAYVNKKAAVEKVTREKNKALADINKAEKQASSESSISLNGQNVVGIGARPVTPIPVATQTPVSAQVENQNIVNSTPVVTNEPVQKVVVAQSATTPNTNIKTVAPQVKVVRTQVVPTPSPQVVQKVTPQEESNQ